MRIRWAVLPALVGVALALDLLGGCAAQDVPRVAGDAAPVGLAPVESVAPEQGTGDPVSRDDSDFHGKTVWAMVYAVSGNGLDAPELFAPISHHDGSGVQILSVDCDPGAREALRLPPYTAYWYTVMYFGSQQNAISFKESNGLSVVGIVAVKRIEGCY